jgi:hypothetical protein
VTEDEAKTKWCPFARYAVSRKVGDMRAAEGLVVNRGHYGSQEFGTRCIASACMAWRNEHREVTVDGVGVIVPDQNSWGNNYERRQIVSGGYCGLAGAPQ